MKEVGSKEQMERKTGTNDQQLLADCNADFQQQLIVNTTSIQCTIHGEGSIVFTEKMVLKEYSNLLQYCILPNTSYCETCIVISAVSCRYFTFKCLMKLI